MRILQFNAGTFVVTGLDNFMQSRESTASVLVTTHEDHEFELGLTNYFEDVPEIFELPGDIPVPIAEYHWTNATARLRTSRTYPLSVQAEVSCCSFYNGDALETSLQANYRPNQYYELAASYDWSRFDMPNGSVDVHIASLNATITFTPFMELALQTQYDNVSESFGFLARYRWEFIPGDELLIVFGQSAIIPSTGFVAQRSQFTIRIGHTFRF